VLVALAGGVVLLSGCSPEVSPAGPAGMPPPEVTVSQPLVQEITDYFEFPGRTQAVGEVDVRSRVTGYIVRVNFRDGQSVRKGELLIEIDPRPYEAALERATGELKRLEALRDKAQADVARAERLRPSGAISQDEYEQHLAQLAVQKASIRSAQAAVRDASLDLEFTRIVSPIDGRVSRERITVGNLVQANGADSAVLTTVVTTDPIYVYFNVDEAALLKYMELSKKNGFVHHPNRIAEAKIPVEIGLANEEGFAHVGTLDFMDNRIEATTGTIRARGVFQNPHQYLTPGLFVRVRIPYGKPHKAMLITEKAIGRDQREKFLLTVNKDNVVEHRLVKVGSLQNGLRVIESGVAPDDWVVVKGLLRARPGVTVSPKQEETVAVSPGTAASAVARQPHAGSSKPD
jgi:RND family efflux transporter MFP subunit